MAGNWASEMGKKSGEVRHDQAQTKLIASGQAKIIDTLATQVPGAASLLRSSGVSDGEAWALATHPDTMRGLKVIIDTVGGALKMLEPKEGGHPKRARKNAGVAPLVEYREQ